MEEDGEALLVTLDEALCLSIEKAIEGPLSNLGAADQVVDLTLVVSDLVEKQADITSGQNYTFRLS